MFMSDGIKDVVVAAGSSAATVLLTGIARLIAKTRRRKQLTLEEAVRKELWDEIGELRAALREASATLMEWQTKNLTLVAEVILAQKNIAKLAELLNTALTALEKIESVERSVFGDSPDLLRAKREIDIMKLEAQTIRLNAAVVSKL